ncbi:TadG family pilus assembly protein [Paraburkholderia megapolitana]|uniref:Uncharacterized membrane protein n=1 Tax=Paraburkholderia megapolitana TaxID=420953 RepID=A0A1I3R9Y8_9BURK|nr:TadG family pilus assembly protein [Paraburkholderia megapolitana]QDQ83731.1 hypothetical protein FNZ07_21470 [Paraburkholderia megapolitana]SFJ42147.1 Uncharacterized membrane protein [Paraburkholderia megapolitana]
MFTRKQPTCVRPYANRTHKAAPRQQRGAVAVLAAIWVAVAMAALGAIDIGNFYFARRDLQRSADLAATAAAETIGSAGGCTAATTSAQGAAGANGLPTTGTVAVTCGRWDPTSNAGSTYFSTTGTPQNAAQVTVSEQVPYFFMGPARTLSATAIAQATNVGSFSVGSGLLSLGGSMCQANGTPTAGAAAQAGILNAILGGLLNTSLSLSAVSYCGLANVGVKVSDLMVAANVATVDQLLQLPINAGSLAALMVTALSRTTVASVVLQAGQSAMQSINLASIPGTPTFPLGQTAGSTTAGVISVSLANSQAALNAVINPLQALIVAAEIAQVGKPAINVAAGLTVPGVAGVTLSLQVIQPAVVAIGEAGKNAAGVWRTQAQTAQIQTTLNVNVGSAGTFLGALLQVNLPLSIQVATATSWLQSTQCATTLAASRSTIATKPGLATLTVGSTSGPACSSPATLANLLGLITVTACGSAPVAPPGQQTQVFDGNTNLVSGSTPNSNNVGLAVANALTTLNQTLTSTLSVNIIGINLGLGALLAPITSAVLAILSPVLTALNQLLVPLLQLLGVQLGVASVTDLSLSCGVANLVN